MSVSHSEMMIFASVQLVPLLRWMPAVWTRYVLYLGHLPLELLSQVRVALTSPFNQSKSITSVSSD